MIFEISSKRQVRSGSLDFNLHQAFDRFFHGACKALRLQNRPSASASLGMLAPKTHEQQREQD